MASTPVENGISFTLVSLLCLTLFFGAFILPNLSHALSDDPEEMRKREQMKIEREIEKSQIKIQRLQSGLAEQQESVERTKLMEKGILSELKDLDIRLTKLAERLRNLVERKEEQQSLIAEKEKELELIKVKADRVQHHMQKRIGAYYKLGKIDLMNITFSTKTLPELLRFHDAFQAVIKYDQEVMQQYRATISELESTRQALTLERGLLDEFITQANENEQSILNARQDKAALLNKIRTQASLHAQAIKEIEQARNDLATALLALRQKEKLFDQGFRINKGKHIAPLDGEIISLFNQERENQFGIKRKSPGIAINSPDGRKIRSIYDGRVIFSGYLKGYGNTIIIDHGYQYFTISSRVERILVKKGTIVKRDDIIGITGSTATILDDGLYFEIRHKDTPLDPLDWLNRKNLTFAEAVKR